MNEKPRSGRPREFTGLEEAKTWEQDRNEKEIMIQWRFTTNDAREKLKRHYEDVRN